MHMRFICSFSKRHAKYFLGALLAGKVCKREEIIVGETGDLKGEGCQWHFDLPDTDIVNACWMGFIAGKKIGYSLGGSFPRECRDIKGARK